MNNINDFAKTDRVLDYIPVVSTFSNLSHLFQKCVISCMKEEEVKKNHRYTHIKQKSVLRCIVLLIPFVGNLLIGIYDSKFNKEFKKKLMQEEIVKEKSDNISIKNIEYKEAFRDLLKNEFFFTDISPHLAENKEFMLYAIAYDVRTFDYLDEKFKSDINFMIDVVNNCKTLNDLNIIIINSKLITKNNPIWIDTVNKKKEEFNNKITINPSKTSSANLEDSHLKEGTNFNFESSDFY